MINANEITNDKTNEPTNELYGFETYVYFRTVTNEEGKFIETRVRRNTEPFFKDRSELCNWLRMIGVTFKWRDDEGLEITDDMWNLFRDDYNGLYKSLKEDFPVQCAHIEKTIEKYGIISFIIMEDKQC